MSATAPGNSVFYWCGAGQRKDKRVYYPQFCLNNHTFNIGDCVYLFPEDEGSPHYLGRIRSAFIDESGSQTPPPHNIEIKWFERRVNLEGATKGIEESEKEVFELEDTDINPIGCISGKCYIIRATNYEEAQQGAQGADLDWYFCRGYFLQASNSFRPYTHDELGSQSGKLPKSIAQGARAVPLPPAHLDTSSAPSGVVTGLEAGTEIPAWTPAQIAAALDVDLASVPIDGFDNGSGPLCLGSLTQPMLPLQFGRSRSDDGEDNDEDEDHDNGGRGRRPTSSSKQQAAKRKATGRICVECGATSTPQWREGPAGPKTLCNACGVRHVRAQQRANNGSKRPAAGKGTGGGSRSSPGSPIVKNNNKAKYHNEVDYCMGVVPEPSSRPIRQAALTANTRTAAFARTGEYPDEDANGASHMGSAHPRRVGGMGGRHGTGSYDSSILSTDSADELLIGMGGKGGGTGNRNRLDSLMALSSIASGELAASQHLDELFMGGGVRGGGIAGASGGPRGSNLWPRSGNQYDIKNGALPALEDLLVDPLFVGVSGGPKDEGLASLAGSKGASGVLGTGGMPKSTPPLGTAPHLSPAGNFLPLPLGLTPSSSSAAMPADAIPPLIGLACNGSTLPSVPPLLGSIQSVSQTEFAALLVNMCKMQPELEAYATVFAEAERSGTQLPESLMQRLSEVKERADIAAKEAAAAEAAVQAVQQVYNARQEAAERAREAATQAALRLKEYVASLASAGSTSSAMKPQNEVAVTALGDAFEPSSEPNTDVVVTEAEVKREREESDAKLEGVVPVCWFERSTSIFPDSAEIQCSRELVELEDVDVNPIGCLAGKTTIIRAKSFEEAEQIGSMLDTEWFYSRGIFKQSTNDFLLYPDIETGPEVLRAAPKRHSTSSSGPEEMANSDTTRPPRCTVKRLKRTFACEDIAEDDDENEFLDDDLISGNGSRGKHSHLHVHQKSAGKQCVECGATQTPQWREGPSGPKTLCNACGVRYNRLRSNRRNGGSVGASFGQRQQGPRSKVPKVSAAAREAASARRPSPEPLYATAMIDPSATNPHAAPCATVTVGGRPMRQAALMAANRNAAFARTGSFPEADENAPSYAHPHHHPRSTSSDGSDGQDDDSCHHSSDSAEDQLLFPSALTSAALISGGSSLELTQLGRGSRGNSSLAVDVTTIGSAIAGSLTPVSADLSSGLMSHHQSTDNLALDEMEPPPSAASIAGNHLRSVALRAVGFCPDISEFGEVFKSFELVRSHLPDSAVEQLLGVGDQVNTAANEAAAADAALQAVMQVMSARQKAAEAARERAVTAVDKLKGCMVDLLEKHSGVTAPAAEGEAAATGLLEAPSVGMLSADMGFNGCGGNAVAVKSSVLGLGWGCGMDPMEMTGLGLLDGMGDSLLGYSSMDSGSLSLISMMQDGMLHSGFGASVEMIECHN